MDQLLHDYHDREIVEWLRFGWPAGRLPMLSEPRKTFKNHKGATDHPAALKTYIEKEKSHDAVIGPFNHIPFSKNVGISPISTRPKKCSTDRRVIIDLSFLMGEGVNDGMQKDTYLGFAARLKFPKIYIEDIAD